MTTAYLVLTSALFVGQAPVQQATHTAPAASSCGSSCSDSCGHGGFSFGLRDRLRGMFHRDNCDPCPVKTCEPCPPKHWKWDNCNTCAADCDPCAGHGLFSRFKGLFKRRGADCCDGGCSSPTYAPSGEAAPGVVHPGPVVVPVQPNEAPKKMPVEPKTEAKPLPKVEPKKVEELKPLPKVDIKVDPKKVQAPNDSIQPGFVPVITTVQPGLQAAPAIRGIERDPF